MHPYLIQLLEGLCFQGARLGCWMTSIELIVELVPSDGHLVCVDDDDIPSHVHGRTVAWLIFSSASMHNLPRFRRTWTVGTRQAARRNALITPSLQSTADLHTLGKAVYTVQHLYEGKHNMTNVVMNMKPVNMHFQLR